MLFCGVTIQRHPKGWREPSATLVPRLWMTFAAVWLLVLVITIGVLASEPLPRGRYAATLVDLTALAVLYLWLTLRMAPGTNERDPRSEMSIRHRVAAVTGLALLVAPPVYVAPSGGMWWHMIYAVVAAGLALPPVTALSAIVVLVAAAMLAAWFMTGVVDLRLLIQLAIGGAAMAVRLLAIVVQQLREVRGELARRAADEERLRIARDLHDLLGRSLSLIVLKSQLASRLLRDAPGAAANEVGEIESSARDALQQVRAAVTGYRHPTLQGELAAARELLGASGVRSVVENSVGALPVHTERLLAWTVREAVTNVIRHSRARECVIRTAREGDCAVVTVADDGLGASERSFTAGSGLKGLAERAAALSGKLTMGPAPMGGFAVAVSVPTAGSRGVQG
jgi:two-component system sensor histidine kinase DesK